MGTRWLRLAALSVSVAACNDAPLLSVDGTAAQTQQPLTPEVSFCAVWVAPKTIKIDSVCWSTAAKAYTGPPPAGGGWVHYKFSVFVSGQEDQSDLAVTEAWLNGYAELSAVFKAHNALADVVAKTAAHLKESIDFNLRSKADAREEREATIDEIVDNLEAEVAAKLDPLKAPDQAKLAEFRRSKTKVDPVLRRAKEKLTAVSFDFKTVAERHATFLAAEATVFSKLQNIATRASTATIQTLGPLQQELIALERVEAPACFDFSIDTARLGARVGFALQDYRRDIRSMAWFIESRNLEKVIPEAAAGLTDAINKVSSYCESRQARFIEAYDTIIDGMKRRSEALVQQAANAANQKVLADARFLRSSEAFLRECTARSAQLATLPKNSMTLKLPYLLSKFQEHEANLTLEPMCTTSALAAASWMDAGCEVIKRDLSKSRSYTTVSAPAIVRTALPRLRTAGVNAPLLDRITVDLNAKNYRAAVEGYDLAVSLSEKLAVSL